jgi:hypothetical protein
VIETLRANCQRRPVEQQGGRPPRELARAAVFVVNVPESYQI